MHVRFEVHEPGKGKRTFEAWGPPSRFNTVGRRTAYLRLYSGRIPGNGVRGARRSKQPEILFHANRDGRIEKVSFVFGRKVYHYDVSPAFVRGKAYELLRAVEEFIQGRTDALSRLAEDWKGETELTLYDPRKRARITLRIHAADVQDMLERHTHLKLGVERQSTLDEFGIKWKKK